MSSTVRVRIAVAVAPDGAYSVAGWSGTSDKDIRSCALDGIELDEGEAVMVHFIEADVPLPIPQTLEGKVVP